MPDEGQFLVVITGLAFGAGLLVGALLSVMVILIAEAWRTKEPVDYDQLL